MGHQTAKKPLIIERSRDTLGYQTRIEGDVSVQDRIYALPIRGVYLLYDLILSGFFPETPLIGTTSDGTAADRELRRIIRERARKNKRSSKKKNNR